jgi:ubiquinone/menaquinone biosynthesis C-methylase UbiE
MTNADDGAGMAGQGGAGMTRQGGAGMTGQGGEADPDSVRQAVGAVYEAIAAEYDQRLAGSGQADELIGTAESEFVLGRVTAGERVLDLGCGTGRYLVPLAAAGARVTGMDLAEAMLSQARCKLEEAGLTAELRQGDLTDLPFPAGGFEVVVSTLTLMHLPLADRQRVFSEMARVLAPGGRILLSVKNSVFERMFAGDRFAAVDRTDPDSEELVFTQTRGGAELRAPWHSFSPRDLTLLCARAGLIVTELRGNTPVGAWLAEEVLADPGVRAVVSGLERVLADVPPLNQLGYHLLVEAVKPL